MAMSRLVTQSSRHGSVAVRVQISESQVNRICGYQVGEAIQRAGEITKQRVQANIRSAGRVDTGAMLGSIEVGRTEGTLTTTGLSVEVYSQLPYTVYQERGTRAHGPVRAQYLRFRPKGSTAYVFARWVRGVTPARFMENASRQLSARDFV